MIYYQARFHIDLARMLVEVKSRELIAEGCKTKIEGGFEMVGLRLDEVRIDAGDPMQEMF